MSYSYAIQKAKEQIDSVNEFINLIEKNSDIFKSFGISVSFKGQSIINSKTPIDSIILISDFKFPNLNEIQKDYVMSDKSVLLSYKSSVKRLMENSKLFLDDVENKLDSISRD